MAEPDVHTAVSLRPRPTFSHRRSNSLGASTNDVELQSLPGYNEANDPYSLRHGLKSADELGRIKANTSRKRKICVPESVEKGAKERQLKAFYETQNENIERLLKPVDDHVREAKEKQESESLQYKIAVHGSFIVRLLSSKLSPPSCHWDDSDMMRPGQYLSRNPPSLWCCGFGLFGALHDYGRRHLRPAQQPDPHSVSPSSQPC
jgi:hypothetical protein